MFPDGNLTLTHCELVQHLAKEDPGLKLFWISIDCSKAGNIGGTLVQSNGCLFETVRAASHFGYCEIPDCRPRQTVQAPRSTLLRLMGHDVLPGLLQNLNGFDFISDGWEFAPESCRKIVDHLLNAIRKRIPKLIQKGGPCWSLHEDRALVPRGSCSSIVPSL